MRSQSLFSLPFALLLASACGGEPATVQQDTEIQQESSELLGGLPSSSRALDAVGIIAYFDEAGVLRPACTGTLIGPRSVLTAKHCAVSAWDYTVRHMDQQPIYFAIGASILDVRELIQMADVDISPVNEGGMIKFGQGYGNDVAVYTLVREATEAKPLPIMDRSISPDDFGERFLSIGFGVSELATGAGYQIGVRRMGPARVRATEGLFLEHIYGGLEAFLEEEKKGFDPEFWPFVEPLLVENYYANVLLPEYDAWVVDDGVIDTQPCFGDSGSPLLRSTLGEGRNDFEIAGVVSGGESKLGQPCAYGTWYATFGPRTRVFLSETVGAVQR